MQKVTAPDVSSAEWRWVILFSGLLVAITLLPYAWAFASNTPPTSGWHFMGILSTNPLDGATYLAKMREGVRGDWLFTLAHTSEPHNGAAIFEFYLFLGHLSRFLGLSPLLMFHIARLVTGFIMYVSLYHLGAVVWSRLRPRRLFFSLLAVGSGLGWFGLLFSARPSGISDSSWLPTDFSIPESIPFFATFSNPHFPLAIALIALLAATFIIIFRPGLTLEPTLTNGGASVALISILLSIVQPQALIPIAMGLCLYIAILTWRTRRIPQIELSWVLLVILPAIPFAIYDVAVVNQNSVMQLWNAQNVTNSPGVLNYLLGFGLLLLVAIPGIWRAIRQFERDGDRFMLVWLVVNAILLYIPKTPQRRFVVGLIIPIVYFAVRALEDYWFDRIRAKWRGPALIALFVFIVPSNILTLILPVFGIINPTAGIQNYLLLPTGYYDGIGWLRQNAQLGDVVLAPPQPSLWIPAYSDLHVVFGHPFETLDADKKLREVADWYNKGAACSELLSKYGVRWVFNNTQYIINPTNEPNPKPGNNACIATLGQPVITFDDGVAIYEVR